MRVVFLLCIFLSMITLAVADNASELSQTKEVSLSYVGWTFDTTETLGFVFKVNEHRNLTVLLRGFATNSHGDYGKVYDERKVNGVWVDYIFYEQKKGSFHWESVTKINNGSEDEKLLLELIKSAEKEQPIVLKVFLQLLREVIKTRDQQLRDMFVSIDRAPIRKLLK